MRFFPLVGRKLYDVASMRPRCSAKPNRAAVRALGLFSESCDSRNHVYGGYILAYVNLFVCLFLEGEKVQRWSGPTSFLWNSRRCGCRCCCCQRRPNARQILPDSNTAIHGQLLLNTATTVLVRGKPPCCRRDGVASGASAAALDCTCPRVGRIVPEGSELLLPRRNAPAGSFAAACSCRYNGRWRR